jgi:immunity protein Imm1 of predicted polymorphic toxin system
MQLRAPFLAELVGTNGYTLLLGLGSSDGCVQFSSNDGAPPYLMAVRPNGEQEGEQDFLISSTPSPVPRRYCLPMQKVAEIAATFLESGERYPDIEWEALQLVRTCLYHR